MDGLHSLSADLEAALARLHERAAVWSGLPMPEKTALLRACRDRVERSAERWSAIAAAIKGVSGQEAAGEEALSGPWGTMRALDAYVRRPRIPARRIRNRPDGGATVRVFPNTAFDRLLLPGVRGDVYLEPHAFSEPNAATPGRVVAVMGAGNVTSIGVLDVLSKLVNDNAVCLLKTHPLLTPLLPVFNDVFAPLIEEGFVSTTSGDAAAGAFLCAHRFIDAVHVTGSTATYRAIRAATAKPLTAELGNVTPAIVMAGRWSDREIAYAAEALVAAKLHNNGYDCIALQVLVLPAQWPQRTDFIAAVERVMRGAPRRPAFYPGSIERFAELTRGRASLRSFGVTDDAHVPPAIVDVDHNDRNEPLFTQEAFSPLLAIAAIGGDPPEYLRAAVGFCNERLAGDLAAHLVANPASLREYAPEVEAAIEQLRYGMIGVNLWCGVGFLLPELPWGAAPGNPAEHIGSGIGWVHNSFDLPRPHKSVLRGPFCPLDGRMRPPWFVTQSNAREIGALLCDYERRRSLATLAKIAWLTTTGSH